MQKKLIQLIASRLAQVKQVTDIRIAERSKGEIEYLCREFMPSGSGFNSGTTLDLDASIPDKRLTFVTSFHHMHDSGMYDGWTHHTVIATPAFDGFDLRVTGRNRNDIKDYIADTFSEALRQDIDSSWDRHNSEFIFARSIVQS